MYPGVVSGARCAWVSLGLWSPDNWDPPSTPPPNPPALQLPLTTSIDGMGDTLELAEVATEVEEVKEDHEGDEEES